MGTQNEIKKIEETGKYTEVRLEEDGSITGIQQFSNGNNNQGERVFICWGGEAEQNPYIFN